MHFLIYAPQYRPPYKQYFKSDCLNYIIDFKSKSDSSLKRYVLPNLEHFKNDLKFNGGKNYTLRKWALEAGACKMVFDSYSSLAFSFLPLLVVP